MCCMINITFPISLSKDLKEFRLVLWSRGSKIVGDISKYTSFVSHEKNSFALLSTNL